MTVRAREVTSLNTDQSRDESEMIYARLLAKFVEPSEEDSLRFRVGRTPTILFLAIEMCPREREGSG